MTEPAQQIGTVEFPTFLVTPGLREDLEPDDLKAEEIQKAVDICPWRVGAHPYERRGIKLEAASCAFQEKALGFGVGLERMGCARCQAHGGPDNAGNPWLKWKMKGDLYSLAVPNPFLPGTFEKPSPDMLDKIVEAAKAIAGAGMASDLLTTMVAADVITPGEGVDLHDRHGLLDEPPAVDPVPPPQDGKAAPA